MKCRRLSLVFSFLSLGIVCQTFAQNTHPYEHINDSLVPFGTENIVAGEYTLPMVRAIADPDRDLFSLTGGKDSIWLSIAPPHTRPSYDLLPFRSHSGRTKSTSFELFLNTTGLRTASANSERKKIFGEILDLNALVSVYNALHEPLPSGTTDILQELSIEYHRAGLMMRFAGHPRNLTLGVEIPIIISFNHIWLDADKRTELEKIFTAIAGAESGGGSFLSKAQTDKLIDLVLLRSPDVRIGDFNFSLGISPLKTESSEATVGVEAIVPLVLSSHFSTKQTSFTYPQPVIGVDYFTGDDLNQKLFQLLFDTLTVFQKTAIVPGGDALKTGIGVFTTLNLGFLENKGAFWGQFRFQHLTGGTRYRLVPVYQKVLPNEFRVAISPVSIVQCTVGTDYHAGSWQATAGYDFYLATRERISAVVIESKAREQLELSRAETPRVKQHKVFGELSYGNRAWQRETTISLGGDYTVSSVGTPREWSLALSIATKF